MVYDRTGITNEMSCTACMMSAMFQDGQRLVHALHKSVMSVPPGNIRLLAKMSMAISVAGSLPL